MDYEVIDEEAWRAAAPPRPADGWEKILDELAEGRYVRIACGNEHERRSAMVNLQRRAVRRGLILERRLANGHLFYHARAGRPATGAVTSPTGDEEGDGGDAL